MKNPLLVLWILFCVFITIDTSAQSFVPDPNKVYYIDCPAQALRIGATGSSESPYTTATSTTGNNVEWKFVAVGNYWHIDRAAGGTLRRLRTQGGPLADMQSKSSTGGFTQFEITSAENGNYFLSLPASANAVGHNRLQVDGSGSVNMVDMTLIADESVQFTITEVFVVINQPVTDFSASTNVVLEGTDINFSDLSTETPTSWSWSFAGGTPATSTAQNPTVTYNTAGTYEVTLTATNGGGSDVETKTAYITVNANTNNLTSANQWYILPNTKSSAVTASDISSITVNGQPAVIGQNVRVKRYYNGAAIIPIISGFSPITLYSGATQTGNSAIAEKHTIYKTTALPLGDNTISSFVLKKGYMATFAANEDGTGRSKVYIAAEENMAIDLPVDLAGEVSFLRVMEWSYVNKRGFTKQAKLDELNGTWFYNWGIGSSSTTDHEYLTMAGRKGLSSDTKISQTIAHEDVTTLLGFNEADDCNAQAGVNGFCVVDTAVAYFKKLSKTGLRLGSPSGTETAALRNDTWTSQFLEKAQAQGIRVDVVCVHWYDRAAWRDNANPSPNVDGIMWRFKKYLNDVHYRYGLPVMITEYNANPGRTHEVNKEFMAKSIEWLEQQNWIERYCWFQPNGYDPVTGKFSPAIPGVADMFDENGIITDVGTVWRDSVSYPSIPQATLESPNLQEVILPYENFPTSIEEGMYTEEDAVCVFPNPASDMFTIKMNDIEKANISIYNVQGQLVHSNIVEANEYAVDSNLFESGIYLIRVIDNNNKIYTTKLIIS